MLGRVNPQLSERVGLSAVLLSVPVWHGVTGDRVGTTRARLLNVVDAGEAEVTPEGGFLLPRLTVGTVRCLAGGCVSKSLRYLRGYLFTARRIVAFLSGTAPRMQVHVVAVQHQRIRIHQTIRGTLRGTVTNGHGVAAAQGGSRLLQQRLLRGEAQVLRIDRRVRVRGGERRTDTAQTRIRWVQNICSREGKDENGEFSVSKARVVQQRVRGGTAKVRQQVNVAGLEGVRVLGVRIEGNGIYLRENLGDDSFAEVAVFLGVHAVEGVELIQRHGLFTMGTRPAVGTMQTQNQVDEGVEDVITVTLVNLTPRTGVLDCATVQVGEGTQQLLLGGVAVTLAGRCSLRFLGRLNHAAVAGRRHGAINRAVRGHGEGLRQRRIGADLGNNQALFVALNVFKPVLGFKRRIDGGRIDT